MTLLFQLLDNGTVTLLVSDSNCVLVVDSIGAQRVKNVCVDFKTYCEARNFEG